VRLNKSKACRKPQIGNTIGMPTESPADLLRNLQNKLVLMTPIHHLRGLLGESTVKQRPSSKIRVISKEWPHKRMG
jgi:hypothetical protein